jgi:16S rRNA (guanine527-N7)-methyltransferase
MTLVPEMAEVRIIEDFPEGSVACGMSRGFASISKAIMITRKLFKRDGMYFHLKGENWARELAEIPSQLCSFWTPSLFAEYEIPVRKQKMAILLTTKIT